MVFQEISDHVMIKDAKLLSLFLFFLLTILMFDLIFTDLIYALRCCSTNGVDSESYLSLKECCALGKLHIRSCIYCMSFWFESQHVSANKQYLMMLSYHSYIMAEILIYGSFLIDSQCVLPSERLTRAPFIHVLMSGTLQWTPCSDFSLNEHLKESEMMRNSSQKYHVLASEHAVFLLLYN